jgi:anti-anti-sigma regulatory factor
MNWEAFGRMNLSAQLRYEQTAHDRGLILHLTGKADLTAVPKMRELLRQLLARHLVLLIIDLSGVTFLNTPFWAAFQRYNQDGAPKSRLVIAGMNPGLTAAFDILMLGGESLADTGIQVYETWQQAAGGV